MTPPQIYRLARELLDRYGLHDWKFGWDNAKRRAGCCKFGSKIITLSRHYARLNKDNDADIIDTLKHETAHALAGPGHGHDHIWQSICIRIGAKPIRCYGANIAMPTPKLRAVCGGCQTEFRRHRRPRRQSYCVCCGPEKGLLKFIPAEKGT